MLCSFVAHVTLIYNVILCSMWQWATRHIFISHKPPFLPPCWLLASLSSFNAIIIVISMCHHNKPNADDVTMAFSLFPPSSIVERHCLPLPPTCPNNPPVVIACVLLVQYLRRVWEKKEKNVCEREREQEQVWHHPILTIQRTCHSQCQWGHYLSQQWGTSVEIEATRWKFGPRRTWSTSARGPRNTTWQMTGLVIQKECQQQRGGSIQMYTRASKQKVWMLLC